MKILVANLGSTSYKYRLYEMAGEEATPLAKGGYDRVEDHGTAIADSLEKLRTEGHITGPEDVTAVGFKTVLGKDLSGCVEADDRVLNALEGFEKVAPAHNPPYAAGIRQFREQLPAATRVALFETAFYQWAPEAACRYAVPDSWFKAGVRRYGFHGASHKFVAERSAELLGREDVAGIAKGLYQQGPLKPEGADLRVISCHLGGSSSIAGISNGAAVGASMGFSPQSGLPQNNRVGDLDSGAVPYIVKTLGISLEEAERQLSRESGLLGLSGVSNDMRDVREAAEKGDARAHLAIDVFVHSVWHWVGAFFFQLDGADAIVFTAGIGENNPFLRAAICANLAGLGVIIDPARNTSLDGEGFIHADESRVKIAVIPANEELVVAREVNRFLAARGIR